ncbi:MAG: class I SAM-dependent methyltransferase [Phycisphaerales bacterium]|nr:MAG: class I SAM-dependent methyltransferase [Phycisphaerales bacterium]
MLSARAGYDRWAGIYDDEDNPLIMLEERYLPDQLGHVDGLRVADIGCGTGRHALRLAASGAKVTAVDFSEGMLAKARRKPHAQSVRFVRHDITAPLPFESASFDRVLCCLVLEHIPDLSPFFAELKRICSPDGFMLLSAMHPAMMLLGITARFTDPATGRETRPQSYPHQIADFIMAATRARLHLDHLSEHAIDQALAAASPRAAKYVDWPLLLLMRFSFEVPASTHS